VTDNPDSFENGLNLSEACARSAPMVGVFNSIDPTVPKNEGSFRRIRVSLRENCAVGVPRHPSSCSVATTNLADRVANPVQCAFAELADGLGLAEAGACIPASSGVISGVHAGRPFVNEVYLGCTGGAGAPTADGWLTIMHVGNAGMCYQDSIEVDELRHPLLVHARRLIPDSEGAGRFRGALGAYSEFSPRDCAMTVAYVSDGNLNPAKGRGGRARGLGQPKPRRIRLSRRAYRRASGRRGGDAALARRPGNVRLNSRGDRVDLDADAVEARPDSCRQGRGSAKNSR
jgi:N-methylhydantoinase B